MNLRALVFTPTLALLFAALPAQAQTSASVAAPTQADPATDGSEVELARRHFAQATKLYKDGDFDAALVQFERAYEVKPNYKVLYNIGQTYFQLRQYVEARDAMQRYVKEGGTQVEGERISAVTKDLADLEKRIAHVTVNVNAKDATVLVDGKKVGTTPLAGPIAMSEGQRTISVEAPNRGVLQRLVRVAGGEFQTLNLTVEEAQVIVVHTKSDASPAHLGAVFWTSAIGAIVIGAGAGVTGYVALNAQHDNKDQQNELGVTPKQLGDTDKRAKNFALTTDILAGAAIVCAGVATVIWLSTPSSKSQVGLTVTPSSANLVGRF
ncbi:MAG: tetratricopeptide repeat protein [Polyangiaceae bacterium]